MTSDGPFWRPPHASDTPTQTVGCRHTNPDFCRSNRLRTVCAFVRRDGMCLQPPRSWAKQFDRLSNIDDDGEK